MYCVVFAFVAIGTVLFETRLGCLDDVPPSRVQDFISAIDRMMSSSYELIVAPSIHKYMQSKSWKRHMDAWDMIFDIGKKSFLSCSLHKMSRLIFTNHGSHNFCSKILSYLICFARVCFM